MREFTPVERARRKRFLAEIQALLAQGEFLKIDLVGNSKECIKNCTEVIRRWNGWITDYFLGTYPARHFRDLVSAQRDRLRPVGGLCVPAIAMAILTVPSDYAEYLKRIGPKPRNMLRKVERKGYRFATFNWADYSDDLYEINTSMAERGGLAMTSEYRIFPPKLEPEPIHGCSAHTVRCYGCFHEETLVAYCVIHVCGELGVIKNVLGHGSHLKGGIMNGLIGYVVQDCLRRGTPKYINYLTLHSRTPELDGFKKRVGFESKVVFVEGRSLMRVRMKLRSFGSLGRVAEPMVRAGWNLVSRFY